MDGNGVRILVADVCDEPRWLLTQLLAMHNYNVHVADDGAEVLREMNTRRYDVIIMNDSLPGLTSPEFVALSKIKWPDSAIVVMSHPMSELAALALQQGAYARLCKPCDIMELLQTVRAAAKQRSRSSQETH